MRASRSVRNVEGKQCELAIKEDRIAAQTRLLLSSGNFVHVEDETLYVVGQFIDGEVEIIDFTTVAGGRVWLRSGSILGVERGGRRPSILPLTSTVSEGLWRCPSCPSFSHWRGAGGP